MAGAGQVGRIAPLADQPSRERGPINEETEILVKQLYALRDRLQSANMVVHGNLPGAEGRPPRPEKVVSSIADNIGEAHQVLNDCHQLTEILLNNVGAS